MCGPVKCCTFQATCATAPRLSRTPSTWMSSILLGRTGSKARTSTSGRPKARAQSSSRLGVSRNPGCVRGFPLDVPKFNGDDSWTLPIPARFLIDRGGVIRASQSDPEYTTRPEPTETFEALPAISSASDDWLLSKLQPNVRYKELRPRRSHRP